jgi:hypothetical protein
VLGWNPFRSPGATGSLFPGDKNADFPFHP